MKKLSVLLLVILLSLAACAVASADHDQAKRLGASALGHYVQITRTGTMCTAPDEDLAVGITKVYYGERYVIYGYKKNDRTHRYWYLISKDGREGWVTAGICNVDMNSSYNVKWDGVGFCYVTGRGVNGKSGPGTNYDYMAYCEEGNGFICLDRQMGNTGKYWVKIRIEGITCWISTGLCEYTPYY